jgi:O-antigen/teichoic acid export membrane protein
MVNHLFGKMMPDYIKQILHTQLFSVLNILCGFATLFILIKYMKVVEYGEYVLIQGFIAFSGLILSQNIYSYARLHIPGASLAKQYGYLKTVISIVILGYLFVVLTSKILNFDDTIWAFFEINSKIGYLVLVVLGFELINLEFMRFFIATKNIYLKNYTQFFQKIFLLIAILVLVYLDSLSIISFLYIFIIGQFLVFSLFIMAINIREFIQSAFMKDVFQQGYQVALPLLPIGLISIALNYTDTLMISKLIDKEHVAQYGFASQIISIAMMMIGSSIVLTLFPYATEAHNNNDNILRTDFFLKMLKFGVALALLFYLLIILNSHFIINILNLDKYRDVPLYLSVLAIFPFFQVLYSISSHHLQLMKIFKIQVSFAVVVIFENMLLNYFMIKEYAVMGATFASLISYVTLSVLYIGVSFKSDKILFQMLKNIFTYKNIYYFIAFIASMAIIQFFNLYEKSLLLIFFNVIIFLFISLLVMKYKKRKFI